MISMGEKQHSPDYWENKNKAEEIVVNQFISEREIEGYLQQKKVAIIVEGKIDTFLFTKIRRPIVDVISVASYLDQCNICPEVKSLVNNKDLVMKFTNELNKDSNYVVIGVQDLDYDEIRASLKDRKIYNRGIRKNTKSTSPSIDIETLLISELSKVDRIPFNHFQESLVRSITLAYIRIGVENMKIKGYKIIEQKDITSLAPEWWDFKDLPDPQQKIDIAKQDYLELCNSLEGVCKALIKGKSQTNLLEQLMESIEEAKESLENTISKWDSFIKGHDLEWFLKYHNRLNKKKFRDKLMGQVNYILIQKHKMFEELESWRKLKKLPELFA